MAQYVEYRHNNSGGIDWMKPEMWENLVKAGWKIAGTSSWGGQIHAASRHGLSLHNAIVEWQLVTGLDPAAEGCNCCGRPHNFTLFKDGEPVEKMQVVRQPNTWKVHSFTDERVSE